MAANERNIGYIRALNRQGYTDAEIARSLRRDSSLISQIKSGKKPGNNLEGNLRTLATEGRVPISGPERRATAEGTPARVRGGYVPTRAGFVRSTGGPVDIQSTLGRAVRLGLQVKIRLHFLYVRKYNQPPQSPGYVDIFDKGYSAARVMSALAATGEADIRDALTVLALERDDVEELQGFIRADIVAGDWQEIGGDYESGNLLYPRT